MSFSRPALSGDSGTLLFPCGQEPGLSHDRRLFALKFVIHMVGDIHQPLHVGSADDLGGNTIANECPVFNPADLDGNGLVDGSDLAKLLGNWGPCFGIDCVADVNGDGTVDGGDLSILLGAWN